MDEQTRRALQLLQESQQVMFAAMLDGRLFPIGTTHLVQKIQQQLREVEDIIVRAEAEQEGK